MKIISCYNIKGGVGKTAAAVNLSHIAAHTGCRVLVWDLDPQGATSFYFRVKAKVKGGGRKLFQRKRPIEQIIKATNYDLLDLIPADFTYRNLDLILDQSKKSKRQLQDKIAPIKNEYDYLIIDCAPSISLVSENVFCASQVLLVPTIPTTLSIRTLAQLSKFLAESGLRNLSVWPFFSMADLRKKLHQNLVDYPPDLGFEFLRTHIPYAVDVERMGAERAPVVAYAPRCNASLAYQALWQEIQTRIFAVD